jgi:hypothetical protein
MIKLSTRRINPDASISQGNSKKFRDVGNFVNLSTDFTDFRDAVLFDLTPASLETQSAQSVTRYTGHETGIYPQITRITQISTAQPLTRRGNMSAEDTGFQLGGWNDD